MEKGFFRQTWGIIVVLPMSFLDKIFGDPNAKLIKSLQTDAAIILAFEPAIAALTDEQLKGKTLEFKSKLEAGASLDDIAFEAFAVVREAAKRSIGQRHYDVQMMGGLALHRGMIAEMRTGEGKTLTSTAPVYLNALAGKGVHMVTVNDYLAKRDAVWMGKVFTFLGLSVGCIQHECGYVFDVDYKVPVVDVAEDKTDEAVATTSSFRVEMDFLRPGQRQDAYACDITYGTNNEYGFDYLRDNMAQEASHMVQRELHYAIVDEVDSILIDEARTPLIISAPAEESADTYYRFADIVKHLQLNEDYNIDEKLRSSIFTEAGLQKVEKALGIENLYAEGGLGTVHHADQALKAQALFLRDRDYIVRDGEVMIVDEFTGRVMEGRRYSEGLHQAIEAKEGVKIQRESRTLATITYQNYFRLYKKLGGMTGTAATEAEELSKTYNLEVVAIPTHKTNARKDAPDRIYKTENGKFLSLVQEVKALQERGQPVLIGTISVEKNEQLSELLRLAGVRYEVLNAKNHEREGEIIAQAGRKGAVTVATNMAGRGVDIILGGNPPNPAEAEEVKALGGLFVLGTERHESRRIDNQLRGRAARQGDPGMTQFYVSLDDDLMRIFGSSRVKSMMDTLGFDDTTPIESKMITRSLESAQKRVEGNNYDTRKHVLEYDDVLNKHRLASYGRRRKVLQEDVTVAHADVAATIEREIEHVVLAHTGERVTVPTEISGEEQVKGDWDVQEIVEVLNTIVPLNEEVKTVIATALPSLSLDKEELARQRTTVIEAMMGYLKVKYEEAVASFGDEVQVQKIERNVLLRAMDSHWMRHLDEMTYLRHTIGLQGYAQRDPLVEYKHESFRLFGTMQDEIQHDVAYNLFKLFDQAVAAKKMLELAPQMIRGMQLSSADKSSNSNSAATSAIVVDAKSVGRNEICPCGSGKKYKKCHGV